MTSWRRSREEEALKKSEARYRSLFHDNSAVLLLIDPETGDIIDANRAANEYYGYERNELLSMKISQINTLNPEDVKKEMGRSVLGQKRRFEFRHRLANGEMRDVEVYSSPINEHDRSFLYSIVHDVTDRKRMEKAMQESEERFREIFDHANDAIQVHETNENGALGRFVDVNEVTCLMLGYSREEMLQMNPLDIATAYHDPPIEQVLEDMRNKGSAKFETEHRRKDGIIVPVEINAHIADIQGRKVTIAVVRDITEKKRTINALKISNTKLNLLTSITRHDLNNQLTALTGYLTLLEKKRSDPSFEGYLKKALVSTAQISAMVQFTKSYEDIGVHAPIWQDIGSLIEDANKEVLMNQVQIVNDIPVGSEIYADPLIKKVFYNLIENAVNHGETISTIHFSTEGRDGSFVMICEDDGVGIPEEMKDELFMRGFGKNHGLGLFLSREILAITGILIEEKGEPGHGARFVMTIPMGGLRASVVDISLDPLAKAVTGTSSMAIPHSR